MRNGSSPLLMRGQAIFDDSRAERALNQVRRQIDELSTAQPLVMGEVDLLAAARTEELSHLG